MSDTNRKITEFDVALGRMLTTTRIRLGVSQKDIANRIGITFQQVQKYEVAKNRIPVGCLCQIVHRCFNMTLTTFLGEVFAPYNNDKCITDIIRALYNINPDGHKFILKQIKQVSSLYPK